MSFALEQDLALTRMADNRFRAFVVERWNVGEVPNGGYSLSLASEAIRQSLDYPQPLSITGHYLAPVTVGEAEIHVEIIRTGRLMGYARALLSQQGRSCLAVTAVFGHRDAERGLNYLALETPRLPPVAECVRVPSPGPFFENMQVDLAPECAGWLSGQLQDDCEMTARLAFADGRPADIAALPLFADSFPPPIFKRTGPTGWVPTLELTLHVHGMPTSPSLLASFGTRVVTNGILEESGDLWDENGHLVARVRQLALLRPA